MKKFIVFLGILILSILTFNFRIYASNSYYLASCAKQNIPTGYYDSLDTTSEATVRQSLCNIISANYVGGTYDSVWNVDSYADADPYNEGQVICLYTGQDIAVDNHGSYSGQWTREHVWCKSHGFNVEGKTTYPYNDCHHLRAAEKDINTFRSNSDFGEVETPTGSDEYGNKWTATIFEPRDEVKGDIARMLFYMMIRYGEYCTETVTVDDVAYSYNLQLVNQDTTEASLGDGRLGNLNTLLKWHYEDPVSDTEIYRNNVVYMFQSNRNPFIDHPEYVDLAFVNTIGSYTEPTSTTPKEPDTISREEVLYKEVNFEETEGFSATTYYKGHYLSGNEGEQWAAFYGTVATTNAISGSQSMQMRWYKDNPSINPQCFMNYDVNNLSHIEFSAKGIANSKVAVVYSYDQGKTWYTNEEISLTTSKKTYSSTISSNGGYGDLRIGFKMILPDTKPTGTSSFFIDDVKIYRGKDSAGSEFSKINTKANLKFNYDESSVEKTVTYYELVTDAASISAGDIIMISANDMATYPYVLSTPSTNNCTSSSATVSDGKLIQTEGIEFEVVNGYSTGTIALKYNNKYFGNESTSSNYFKGCNTLSDKTSFTVSITEDGNASLVIKDSTITRNTLQFNASGKIFACYAGTQKPISIYKKITEKQYVPEYSYNDTYLRFVGVIGNDLYEDIVTEDSNAVFGIALSKNGTDFTNYECEAVKANLVDGKLVDSNDGEYTYFALKLLTPKEHFSDLVYAKAYVTINGNTYYMSVSTYSVESIVDYYLNNLTLTLEQTELLGGLVE